MCMGGSDGADANLGNDFRLKRSVRHVPHSHTYNNLGAPAHAILGSTRPIVPPRIFLLEMGLYTLHYLSSRVI